MGFALHTDRAGQSWLVDVDGVKQIVRSYVRSACMLRRSKLNYDKQDLGPLGTFPLTMVTVQTAYSGLLDEVSQHARPLLEAFNSRLKESGQKAFEMLLGLRSDNINNNETLREMQESASLQTRDAIDKVQGNIETWKRVATFVRDFSADTLMVGVTLLSGGTAAIALGGASALKGSFAFEDKKLAGASTAEATGAASLEAGTDLVVGVISLGTGPAIKEALATRSANAALRAGALVVMGAGIDGTSEFAKAVIDGKSVQKGLIAAGTRAGLDVVSVGLGTGLDAVFSTTRLAGLSFPVTVTRSSAETQSLTAFALNSSAALGEDMTVSVATADAANPGVSWHNSLACTYIPLGDSDLVYVQRNAMRRAKA